MKLHFTRTETVAIDLPNPEARPVHKADAESWANEKFDGGTRLEAEARAAAEGATAVTTTGWTLEKVEGAVQADNPFATLPKPPRKRGPRPAGDGPGQQQAEG